MSVLVCTAWYLNGTRRYKAVQGGTKRYQEVPSCTKTVVSSTDRYILVHTGLMLNSTFRYIQVRTALYWSFLLNQGTLSYQISCCNAAWLEALYSRSMKAQVLINTRTRLSFWFSVFCRYEIVRYSMYRYAAV